MLDLNVRILAPYVNSGLLKAEEKTRHVPITKINSSRLIGPAGLEPSHVVLNLSMNVPLLPDTGMVQCPQRDGKLTVYCTKSTFSAIRPLRRG